jgi:hypothetical protein
MPPTHGGKPHSFGGGGFDFQLVHQAHELFFLFFSYHFWVQNIILGDKLNGSYLAQLPMWIGKGIRCLAVGCHCKFLPETGSTPGWCIASALDGFFSFFS